MSLRRNAVLASAALLLSMPLSSTSCSSKSSTSFGQTDDGGGSGVGSDDSGVSSGGSTGGINLGDAHGSSSGLGTGTCKDGTYTGMYTCNFSLGDGGAADSGGLVITGNISFQLMHSMSSGENFIDTATGTFGGTCCLMSFSLASTLNGTLDCNTGTFTGTLSMGSYNPTGIWAAFIEGGTFMGPLTADYNGTTSTFENGTWNLTVPGYGRCPGTWTATYTDQ
jgi:hypothetical protein